MQASPLHEPSPRAPSQGRPHGDRRDGPRHGRHGQASAGGQDHRRGCGAGILSEALARIGTDVTVEDICHDNIVLRFK